jgi:hypothetical protein
MLSRMTLLMPAVLAICLAANCLTVDASRAADECLSKPNAPSPNGSHWYYRIDRATNRQCWYLGPEGAKVRSPAPRAVSQARPPAAKARPQPISEANSEDEALQPAQAAHTENTTVVVVAAAEEDAAKENLSTRWSSLPKAANSGDRTSPAMSNSYAEEQVATDEQDEMPLIWPILTPAELAAVETPAASTIPLAQLAAALAAVLGIAALIVRIMLGLPIARKPRASNARDRRGRLVERNMVGRPARARPPASEEATDIEARVRGLLRELQRRRDEAPSRDFDHRSRRAMA